MLPSPTFPTCEEVVAQLTTTRFKPECPSNYILGQGSFGVAYRLREIDGSTTLHYAVKVQRLLGTRAVNKFKTEVATMKKLCGHKNIVRFDTAMISGVYGMMVMELGTQGTLESYIKVHRDLHKYPFFTLELFRRLLNGAQWIHQNGFVHTDLKPGNIILDSLYKPKIIDFGQVLAMGTMQPNHSDPYYYDPQSLLSPFHTFTEMTDIHALGMILYEMVHAGQKPFSGFDMRDYHKSLVKGDYVIAKDNHWLVAYLIAKCLSHDNSNRRSIASMLKDIEDNISKVPHLLDSKDRTPKTSISSWAALSISDFKPSTLPQIANRFQVQTKKGNNLGPSLFQAMAPMIVKQNMNFGMGVLNNPVPQVQQLNIARNQNVPVFNGGQQNGNVFTIKRPAPLMSSTRLVNKLKVPQTFDFEAAKIRWKYSKKITELKLKYIRGEIDELTCDSTIKTLELLQVKELGKLWSLLNGIRRGLVETPQDPETPAEGRVDGSRYLGLVCIAALVGAMVLLGLRMIQMRFRSAITQSKVAALEPQGPGKVLGNPGLDLGSPLPC